MLGFILFTVAVNPVYTQDCSLGLRQVIAHDAPSPYHLPNLQHSRQQQQQHMHGGPRETLALKRPYAWRP
jgi:hypothetical protein